MILKCPGCSILFCTHHLAIFWPLNSYVNKIPCAQATGESLHLCVIPLLLEPVGFFHFRKSQGAAVGALVRMLKKAAPLHQGFTSENLSYGTRPETLSKNTQEPSQSQMAPTSVSGMSSSGLVTRKTTTDALEELQNYKELRNSLVMRGSKSHVQYTFASAV